MKEIMKQLETNPYKKGSDKLIYKRTKLIQELKVLQWVLGWHL